MFHHEHLRGQVYTCERRPDATRSLDCSFDCTVLWDTIATYAAKNEMDPYKIVDWFVKSHVYSPSDASWEYTWTPPTRKQRWDDVQEFLRSGKLCEAIAALEVEGEADEEGTDWADIVHKKVLEEAQPHMVKRLKIYLHRPASRADLIQVLGSLSDPFTYMGNELDLLNEEDQEQIGYRAEPPYKKRCYQPLSKATVWDTEFCKLTESQNKAATALGWSEESWNMNRFHLPRSTAWEDLSEDMRKNLSELGESSETWNSWKFS